MRLYNTVNYHASEGDGAERFQETGIQLCHQLKAPASGSDCTMLSCVPKYDVQVVDSAFQSFPINEWDGFDYELNINCNHNASYEPLANEGCGCTGSYNGGAGAGTASCGDNGSYYTGEHSSDHGGHQGSNVDYKYVAEFSGPSQLCPPRETPCYTPLPPKTHCHPYEANTYHRPRNNTSPQCMDHYVGCDSCCSECPDTYELVRNTDAQRYKGRGPDRSQYFADSCH
ncbi:unnamed protein product [Candidula unifasciata]|uniref:Uncharacterized protein n=1 Tax=Candidula unifasciata TaxID=100452 RepID=A0A8S3Z4X3_9EUPU|nr:unnamed protein product [Candidula unifasciata]